MQNSVFNNPMLGAGLAELVKAYIGDPEMELRLQNQQLDNQYRQLQIEQLQGKMGGTLGDLVRSSGGGGGGKGGGSAGAPAVPGKNDRKLTQSELDRLRTQLKDSGYEGVDQTTIINRIMEDYASNPEYLTLDQAAANILPDVRYDKGDVIDPNDSWYNPLDWVRGPELGPDKLVIPPAATAPVAPVGQPDPGGIPTITDPAQLQALPSGTRFKAPDGSVRIKP